METTAKAKNRLRRKLAEGISGDGMSELVAEAGEKKARAVERKTNPHKFRNKRAQRLSDLWFSQGSITTTEQQNGVGLAYISKVLGLGDEIAERFIQGDWNDYQLVGMRQGGVEQYVPDLMGFWERVEELFPEIYETADIYFLVNKGGVDATHHFLWQLEFTAVAASPILRSLSTNAHAFK